MQLPDLPLTAIAIGIHVADWRAAVTAAGDGLVRSGSTGPGYTKRMIDVIAEGLSVVTLAEPVAFGHPHNDPVSVVLGLAVTTGDELVLLVAELANVFNDPRVIPALAAATDAAGIRALLGVTAPAEEASGVQE